MDGRMAGMFAYARVHGSSDGVGACDYFQNMAARPVILVGGGAWLWTTPVDVFCGMFTIDGNLGWDGGKREIGACDKFWSYLSGIQYAYCGGGCASVNGEDSGTFYLYVFSGPGYGRWTIGACDYSSFNSGDIGCLLWGVGGSYDTKVGGGMFTRNDFVVTDRVYWFGACFM